MEMVTLSWETVVAIVTPLIAAGVWIVKWIVARSDRDRDDLLKRMDADRADATEDRKILRDSLHALRNAVQVASSEGEMLTQQLAAMTQAQQRIVWTQERILAHIEARARKDLHESQG